ncbi:MAG: sulfurtransferase TusA family protein [Nitrospirae bacterium]|nr:sulfurtransferase TusA family protein [Nitrospirota bacterium]
MNTIKPDITIDIRGLTCPYTFVKAKLAMEAMEMGQVLEILLDHEEACESIPKAMTEHGHTLLRTEKVGDRDWTLLIRKERE